MRRSTLSTAMARWMIVALVCPSLLLTLAGPACAESPADREAKRLQALFDTEWQWHSESIPS